MEKFFRGVNDIFFKDFYTKNWLNNDRIYGHL